MRLSRHFERTFTPKSSARAHVPSELGQWQFSCIFEPSSVLFQSTCSLQIAAYAYGNFHQDFISGRIVAIGCPKLDDLQAYLEKLTAIFLHHDLASVTVVRMEVPCCGGIVRAVRAAMEAAGAEIPYREVVIGTQGNIVSDQTI